MPASDQEAVLLVIEQLSKYVEQLRTCGEDPEVDVEALNRACADRLSALQQLMPLQTFGNNNPRNEDLSERSRLMMALQVLESQTQGCIEALKSALGHTGEEIERYRSRQRAIRAYAGKR